MSDIEYKREVGKYTLHGVYFDQPDGLSIGVMHIRDNEQHYTVRYPWNQEPEWEDFTEYDLVRLHQMASIRYQQFMEAMIKQHAKSSLNVRNSFPDAKGVESMIKISGWNEPFPTDETIEKSFRELVPTKKPRSPEIKKWKPRFPRPK